MLSTLPTLNALLNACSALFLIRGYVYIRQRNVLKHRKCMLAAFSTSTAFLISYLIYHAFVGSVAFEKQGWIRPIYFSILISHIILAALVPPLALRTLYLAWKKRFDQHRLLARWTWPIWMYVSITGILVYVMLYVI